MIDFTCRVCGERQTEVGVSEGYVTCPNCEHRASVSVYLEKVDLDALRLERDPPLPEHEQRPMKRTQQGGSRGAYHISDRKWPDE